jgi:CRISPR-associated endonuclease/helicase Cas3
MSLDMDADLLVTEWCPITSLIQRMGRCNRARVPRKDAGEVLVYQPEDPRPYGAEDLTGLQDFLDALCAREWIDHAGLEVALRNAPIPPALGDKACSFLQSGPYALGDEDFRDIEEFTTPALLADDVPLFLDSPKAKRPGFVVPVPRRLRGNRDARLPHYLAVAPQDHYHAAVRFCDAPLTSKGGR